MAADDTDSIRLGPAAYQALYENSPDGVLFTVPDGRVVAANPAACAILGMTEADICRAGRQGLADADDPRWDELLAIRTRQGHASGVARMRRGDGELIEVEMSAKVFSEGDGQLRTCTIIRDVTARVTMERQVRRLTEQLYELSLTDELTGLRNRRGVEALGPPLFRLADRQGMEVQILFLDVVGMKQRNDTQGHGAGDDALRAVAQALTATFRQADVLARMGGDEFLAMAVGLRPADRPALERRIRQHLAEEGGPAGPVSDGPPAGPVPASPGPAGPVEVSFGWATRRRGDPVTLQDLVADADTSMYRARAAERPTRPSGTPR